MTYMQMVDIHDQCTRTTWNYTAHQLEGSFYQRNMGYCIEYHGDKENFIDLCFQSSCRLFSYAYIDFLN